MITRELKRLKVVEFVEAKQMTVGAIVGGYAVLFYVLALWRFRFE